MLPYLLEDNASLSAFKGSVVCLEGGVLPSLVGGPPTASPPPPRNVGSNADQLVETLREIAELLIWGDQHNPEFFECASSSAAGRGWTLCASKASLRCVLCDSEADRRAIDVFVSSVKPPFFSGTGPPPASQLLPGEADPAAFHPGPDPGAAPHSAGWAPVAPPPGAVRLHWW